MRLVSDIASIKKLEHMIRSNVKYTLDEGGRDGGCLGKEQGSAAFTKNMEVYLDKSIKKMGTWEWLDKVVASGCFYMRFWYDYRRGIGKFKINDANLPVLYRLAPGCKVLIESMPRVTIVYGEQQPERRVEV